MNEYKAMIEELLKDGYSLRSISRDSNLSYGTIHKLYNSKEPNPTSNTIKAITRLYNANKDIPW